MCSTFGKSIHSPIGCIKCSFVTLGVALTFLSFSYILWLKYWVVLLQADIKKKMWKKRKRKATCGIKYLQLVQTCYPFISTALFLSTDFTSSSSSSFIYNHNLTSFRGERPGMPQKKWTEISHMPRHMNPLVEDNFKEDLFLWLFREAGRWVQEVREEVRGVPFIMDVTQTYCVLKLLVGSLCCDCSLIEMTECLWELLWHNDIECDIVTINNLFNF